MSKKTENAVSASEKVGFVHSIESLGAFDGPGLRTIVFLYGCPMRCKYCHNPDMIFGSEGKGAMTVNEVIAKVKRSLPYTDGGVTLSGGEPLMQDEFTRALLKEFKRLKVHTALDTAGSIYDEEALMLANLVILDIKHTDEKKFRELCGYSSENMLKTLKFLKQKRKKFWVRQVIVPGITDDEENILKLKEMASCAEKIELLPYHTMGVAKWEKLGIDYPLSGVQPPSKQTMDRLNSLLK